MMALQNFLLFAGCSMFSLYLFPVGGVQIAHVLLAMAACIALLNDRIRFTRQGLLLLLLAAVSFSREGIAVISGAPLRVLFQPLFILFNLATFVAVYTIYFHSRTTQSYQWGITLAVVIALASLLFTGVRLTDTMAFNLSGSDMAWRAIGSFQNPNQLAYFATIAFSITALLYTFKRVSLLWVAILVPATLLLAMASQSKAGIVGLLLGTSALLAGTRSGRAWAGAAVVVLAAFWIVGDVNFDRLLFVQRLLEIGSDSDDSFAARGYFLLFENAQNALDILFGLGTYHVKAVHGNEVHSTYLAFFVMYGFVGGTLYMAFIASWLWALYRAVSFSSLIAIAGPPMLYGVAHNGTRFSILYAMMALSLALCEERGLSVHRMRPDAVRRRMLRSNLVPSGLARLEGREYLGARKR